MRSSEKSSPTITTHTASGSPSCCPSPSSPPTSSGAATASRR